MIRTFRSIPVDKLKLLVFDLDGTLVDSELDLAHAVNATLRHYGRPELSVDVVASYIGDGAPMLMRRSLGDPQDENYLQEALHYFMAYYREHKLENTYTYPGVPDVLARIHAQANGRLQMAVLSNKPVGPSRGICEGLGLSPFLVHIYGGNSFETKKPDPLGALNLLKETGTTPDQAIMIGDSHNDVLTARNAGMWSLGVTYGFSPETLKAHPPDVLVDSVEEWAEVLGFPAPRRESTQVPSREGFTD